MTDVCLSCSAIEAPNPQALDALQQAAWEHAHLLDLEETLP